MKVVVFDIGGTSIKYGIFEEDKLLFTKETPTNAKNGGQYIYNVVCSILDELKPFDAIGISTAGQVNHIEGSITYANENIPNYTGMKWKECLQSRYNVPICVENDVNAAAIGEMIFGAGKNNKDFICITYGTGIGGAIVINGDIYYGSSLCAGEFGALKIEGNSKDTGFFENSYESKASVTALVKKALTINSKYINARKLFEDINDELVLKAIDEWTDDVVYGLSNIIHILNPPLVILGGGIMNQQMVLDKVNEKILHKIMPSFVSVKIVKADLGNNAGLYGVYYRVSNCTKR